jgi:hypothetical protein
LKHLCTEDFGVRLIIRQPFLGEIHMANRKVLCALSSIALMASLAIANAGEGDRPRRGGEGGGEGGGGNRREGRGEGGGGGDQRPDPGSNFIKFMLQHAADLNLSAAQKAKLEEMMKNGPISILTDEQKKKLRELGPPPRPDEAQGGGRPGGDNAGGGGGGEGENTRPRRRKTEE